LHFVTLGLDPRVHEAQQSGETFLEKLAMRYAVLIEKADGNYSAYVPDLPDCATTGATPEEAESEIRGAVRFHIEGLREDGLAIPESLSRAEYVEARSDDPRLHRRPVPRMPQLHAGAERHVPQMRHLRVDDGV